MKNYLHIQSIIFFSIILFTTCNSQNNNTPANSQKERINRKAVVSGRFYSGNKLELINDLQKLFANAKPKAYQNVHAIISPHAGYVFSYKVTNAPHSASRL